MSDIREEFEKHVEIPESSIYWHQESGQYLPNSCISDDGYEPHIIAKRSAHLLTQRLEGFIDGYRIKSKSTHYAVIDEHGEIVQAFKVASYRNAEFLCNSLIQSIIHDHDTSGWTVKGVTIHE